MKRIIRIVAAVSACLWMQSCGGSCDNLYQEVHISASEEAVEFLSDHGGVLSRPIFSEEGFESKTRIELLSRKDSVRKQDVSFVPEGECRGILMYIHGGAWVFGAEELHTRSCEMLAKETGFKVVVPDYPLAPENTFDKAFDHLEKVYMDLLKEGKVLAVGGDSAGGNIALAFVESLKEKGIALPAKLILISPCVDMALDNPEIAAIEPTDPVLAVYGLKECAKMWMGDAGAEDFHFRPLCGDLEGLPDVLLFVGDKEVFYPDCRLLSEALKGRTRVKFIVGHGLWHIFPLYFFLPEGEQCREIIADFMDSKRSGRSAFLK